MTWIKVVWKFSNFIYNTVRNISRQEVSWSRRAESTFEMDSAHKNKKISIDPKCLQPFSTILIYKCRKSFSCAPRGGFGALASLAIKYRNDFPYKFYNTCIASKVWQNLKIPSQEASEWFIFYFNLGFYSIYFFILWKHYLFLES